METTDNTRDLPASQKKHFLIRLLPLFGLGLILVVHFCFLLSRFAPAIVAPDANGYWAQGSLLFTTGRTWFEPETDAQYIGMHWLVTESGRYFSRYPPGLAVVVGLVYTLLGFKASVLVNPVLAMLSLAGLYFLLRRLLRPGWSLAGVFVLAVNPIFNQHALSCDAHIAVTFCLTWGLYFLLRWSEGGGLWTIFLAGLVLGCIPTIRYPEALFGLGVGVFLLWHVRSRERIWLHYLAAIAGAALPLVPLLIRNQLAFGAFYRTAYALTNEQTGFGWDYFKSHFVSYVRNLHGEGVGPFFPLGVIGMIVMCCSHRWRRIGALLAVLAVPSTLLYMSYYWGPQRMAGATMRFLIPTFICYILAGLWMLSQVTARAPLYLQCSVLGGMLFLQFIWGGFDSLTETVRLHHQKAVLARATDAIEKTAKHGDIIIANQQILQHLDFVRHWRLVDPMALTPGGMLRGMDRFMRRDMDPDAPTPMQREKQEMRAEKYKGLAPWEQERGMAREIHEWAGEHKVYYVGAEKELAQMPGAWFNARSFKVITRVSLPEPPPMPEQEGILGGGARRRVGGPGDGLPPPGPGGPDGDRFRPPDGGPFGMFGRGQDGRFQRRDRPGGMGMGMGRWGFLQDEKELVIAEWTYTENGDRR